jgi:hypothetical protein
MDEARIEVVCEGNPREMGLAQGSGLRARIAGARRALRQLEAFRLRQPWWLPYPLFLHFAERRAARLLGGALAEHAPAMAERLAGMAEGAVIRPAALHLLNAMEAAMSSVGDCTAVPPPGACSAIAVRGRRSATGDPIIARNFDYLPLIQPFYGVRESRPLGQFRSMDFTVAPLCGTIDGVNERGLCITYNYAFTTDCGTPAPPISMTIADALASCDTVAHAAHQIASRPRWGGGLLMLADAAGDIASLELSSTRSRLRRCPSGEDILFHTNAFFCPEMREVEISPKAVFTPRAPAAIAGIRILESPELRGARLADLLGQADRLGPDELSAILADHGPTKQPDANTLCIHSPYWQTTACVQLFPRARRMRIAYGTACSARYQDIVL